MEIKRDLYLNKLIRSMHNGMIKVVTGTLQSLLYSFSIHLETLSQFGNLDEHFSVIWH